LSARPRPTGPINSIGSLAGFGGPIPDRLGQGRDRHREWPARAGGAVLVVFGRHESRVERAGEIPAERLALGTCHSAGRVNLSME